MITGSCLCGGVKIEVEKVIGPFELCHCNRCRSVSGSAFLAAVVVHREDFRFIQGQELVQVYDAPIVDEPPAYRSIFCRVCGCPVPDPNSKEDVFEIAAGIFPQTENLKLYPDKHIFVENKSSWYQIQDDLPQFTKQQLIDHRNKQS